MWSKRDYLQATVSKGRRVGVSRTLRTEVSELGDILRLVEDLYSNHVGNRRKLLGKEGENRDGLVLIRGVGE
jgi:hypothetical protein